MRYLSVTRLKLKSAWYFLPFWMQSQQVFRQIRTSEGFLIGKVMATPTLAMWTMSLWESEIALRAFYLRGSHRVAMAELNQWASEAAAGHYSIETTELPSWNVARDQLEQIAYFSKLGQPSDLHQRKIIPTPKVAIYTETLRPIAPTA